MTSGKTFRFVVTAIIMMASSETAVAQSQNDCVVDPNNLEETTGDKDSLTKTMGRCDGVLKPELSSDPEIVEPAPDVGETPVISPEDIPTQPAEG
ncbi:hypothetical protein AAFN47_06225 [Hoeflea sp. CAU 1731]